MSDSLCAECGEPVTLPNLQNLCSRCRFILNDPMYAQKRAEAEARKAFMAELGMPQNALWKHIKEPGIWYGEQWQDYYIELFGMTPDYWPGLPCPWPFWRLFVTGGSGPGIVVQVWNQKVFHNNSEVYGEIRWHPDHGKTTSIKGVELDSNKKEIDWAWRGIKLLRHLVHGGRKVGTTIFNAGDFITHSIKGYRELLDKYGEHPSDNSLASYLGISRATFYRYLKAFDTPLSQIRIEALNSPQDPESSK
jgi:hypothetical protein